MCALEVCPWKHLHPCVVQRHRICANSKSTPAVCHRLLSESKCMYTCMQQCHAHNYGRLFPISVLRSGAGRVAFAERVPPEAKVACLGLLFSDTGLAYC